MNSGEKVIQVAGSITVDELAKALGLPVTQVIGGLFKNGIMATINQRLDFETAAIMIEELGISNVRLERREVGKVAEAKRALTADAKTRPPIVAVMGHVDHGKTTLLDTLLHKKTVEGEAGGITQHISAYQLEYEGRMITFLDTPGHEAFAAIRQHGAMLTDIVVIVVAADDGVKPQTGEAIKFAQSANAKIIVAINKIDKEGANVEMTKSQLATEFGLNPEEWGGDTIMVPISAKVGTGLDKLLDMILLTADIEDLRADVKVPAEGLVIESHMEVGKGSVVNLLVTSGELKVGEFIVAGGTYAKVRTMMDWRGRPKGKATPSTPIVVTGFKELPKFGDAFIEATDEKIARKMAIMNLNATAGEAASANVTSADLLRMMSQSHDSKAFNVIIKGDVLGSVTSVVDSLKMIDTKGEIALNIVATGVGDISENDIYQAVGENTVVYGFSVDISASTKRLAARDGVTVRIFRVIYELLDDAKREMEKLLPAEVVETEMGTMAVRGVFRTERAEVIAGGEVLSGRVKSGYLVRVLRGKEVIGEAEVTSTQRQKLEATELVEGETGGLALKTTKKIALEVGDRLAFFTRETKEKKL
jgi:translation initiation factor IF-2